MNMKRKLLLLISVVMMLALAGCSNSKNVENEPITIMLNSKEVSGLFTGQFVKGKPQGDGKFIADENKEIVVEGVFENGKIKQASITYFPYVVTFQDSTYKGIYVGKIENGVPSGEGKFDTEAGTDKTLHYSGIWKDGQFSEKGHLETNHFTVHFEDVDRTGKFEGDVINGIANGTGIFRAANDDNQSYQYKGKWKDGIWNGQGEQKFDDEEGFARIGTFTKGDFTPTLSEYYISWGTDKDKAYSPSDKAIKFMDEHANLFPTKKFSKLKKYVDRSIQYKRLNKSPHKYGDKLIKRNCKITQIWEKKDSWRNGKTTTVLNLYTSNGEYYYIYYLGNLKDLYEGDSITFYGLPLGDSSYENISGGTTLTQMIAGCYISKN